MQTDLIFYALLFGGGVCALGQILIDLTALTPARILVGFTCLGAVLFALGAYEPLLNAVGVGASLPIIGFGATIGRGVKEAVDSIGALGILSGGITAAAAGISLSVLFGAFLSLIFRSHPKRS